ncbi:hypothetical protein RI367_005471 [Sorochytrium milnesiophthora]
MATTQLQTPPRSPLSQAQHKALFVCDFDYSLIDVDSDEFVLSAFGSDLYQKLLQDYASGKSWVAVISECLTTIQESRGSLDDIAAYLRRIPMHRRTVDMIRTLKEEDNCDIVIISDANTFFIETVLEAYNLRHCVDKIITNISSTQTGKLLIQPLRTPATPHNCTGNSCPPNLCKTFELTNYLATTAVHYQSVHYIGDGMNDRCPIFSGLITGTAFVRKGRRLHMYLTSDEGLAAWKEFALNHPTTRLAFWDNGDDLFLLAKAALKA